jgi:RND family efflux transporter MFP subunit
VTGRRVGWIAAAAVVSLVLIGAAIGVSRGGGEAPAARGGGPGRGGPQATAVRAEPVEEESLTLRGRYTGELDADAAEVGARTGGRLEEVLVRIGDVVAEGDVLARVDAAVARRQLAEARAAVQAGEAVERRARAQLELARRELERTEPLLEGRLVSAQEVDALRSRVDAATADADGAAAQIAEGRARAGVLHEQVSQAVVRAPFAGRIAERHQDPGTVVAPGTPIVRLVAEGPLRVQFRVPERDLGRVQAGRAIEVTTQATGDARFTGTVSRLSAEVARTDRTLAVEGLLSAEEPLLRPGMFAEVHLELGILDDALLVPGAGLVERVRDAQTTYGVLVADGDVARWRDVRVLGRDGDRVAVEAALEPGDLVLVLGHEDLADGSPIRIVGGDR